MAQSLFGRSCILCFETVFGMNEITSTPTLTKKKNKKISQNLFLICNDIFENFHSRGWGLVTLFYTRYKMAENLFGRSCILCFETVIGINEITPTSTPTPKNKKISNFFLICNDIVEKIHLRGLATLSFNRYKMAQSLLGTSLNLLI